MPSTTSGERTLRKPRYLDEFTALIPDNFVAAQMLSHLWQDPRVEFQDKLAIQGAIFSFRDHYPWVYEELCEAASREGRATGRGERPPRLYDSMRRVMEGEWKRIEELGEEAPGREACKRGMEALDGYRGLPMRSCGLHGTEAAMRAALVQEYITGIHQDLQRECSKASREGRRDFLEPHGHIARLARATLLLSDVFFRSSSDVHLRDSLCNSLYDYSSSLSYAKLIEFAELCSEYNAEWALASFEWDRFTYK